MVLDYAENAIICFLSLVVLNYSYLVPNNLYSTEPITY